MILFFSSCVLTLTFIGGFICNLFSGLFLFLNRIVEFSFQSEKHVLNASVGVYIFKKRTNARKRECLCISDFLYTVRSSNASRTLPIE